jgi:hypothetical protein
MSVNDLKRTLPNDMVLQQNYGSKGQEDIIPMKKAVIEGSADDIFIVYDGKRIAKRGHPGTPQAGTWVSIEPGYRVSMEDDGNALVVEYQGKTVGH